jgi:hypothetical protein
MKWMQARSQARAMSIHIPISIAASVFAPGIRHPAAWAPLATMLNPSFI